MDVLLCSFEVDLLLHSAVHYAQCIVGQKALLDRCVRFLDHTKVFNSSPGGPTFIQKACYCQHKQAHCLRHLTVTMPDGLIVYLHRLEEGRRHDINFYRKSNLEKIMQHALVIKRKPFYVFGDLGFVMRPWMQIGYDQSLVGLYESMYNWAISSTREAVNWF